MRAPTPKDTIHREGTAALYRFRAPAGQSPAGGSGAAPVLLVPSLINRWYVLDLREGGSLAGALAASGLDVYCLDWGVPEDEDRYLTWEDVLGRLRRASRMVQRNTGAARVSMVGYCMGATLSGIHASLHPESLAGLVNLAGPFDFSGAGLLGRMTDPRWFDVDAIAAAGNIGASQMQSGFLALRPTQNLAKWVGLVDRANDASARDSFEALDAWASDNIPFPAAAYVTYIRELYQQNRLIAGTHHVGGRRVDLSRITCPLLTIAAERDAICPLAAAGGLEACASSTVKDRLIVPGGHVGAVVGSRASRVLYPELARWLAARSATETSKERPHATA